MDLELSGKRAVVTGSTAGIGRAIAAALAKEGAEVLVNGRTQARVDAAIAELRRAQPGAKLVGVAADLGTAAGVEAIVHAFPDADVLVNNVGIFEAKPFEQIPDADWLRFFETNVMSGVRLSRAYLPGMRQRGFGRIVFISSESALQIPAEMVHYGMTKTAQLSVARGIAESLKGVAGVTVNTVSPGPTRSEGVAGFVQGLAAQRKQTEEQVEQAFFEHMRPSSLLQRFITPEEIAQVVAFVASARASAITGANLRADGGVVRAIG
jgi:NAD(P)-dependent dehydrogenase (short-subunit alcohol dehydrogenase family)